jgi:hypothetical protein
MNDPGSRPIDILRERVAAVRSRIGAAAARAGRESGKVTLVAVTKTVSPAVVALVPLAGILDVGENRVPPAQAKRTSAPAGLRWHLIGHLQRNKARRALEIFTIFHSVDSERLLVHLDRIAGEMAVAPEVLLQVKISGEAQKHGVAPDDVRSLLSAAAEAKALRVRGLMAMASFVDDPEDVREEFRLLAGLLAEANRDGWYREPLTELSMGMTNDFEVAVEEGATMVRVGTALFRDMTVPPGVPRDGGRS